MRVRNLVPMFASTVAVRSLMQGAVVALALTGCGNATTSVDMTMPSDLAHTPGDLSPENLDLSSPIPAATTAVVTTGDFTGMTGTLATIGLTDGKVQKGIDTTLDPSNAVRVINGKVIVLDQIHGAVRFYDPETGYKNPIEIKTGAMSNPHDIVAVPASSKFYVALYGNKADVAIGVIDLMPPATDGGAQKPALVKSIAVPQAAKDPDGIPEVNDLYLCGGFAYVTAQDLDESKGFAPTGPSRIIALDTTRDAVDSNLGVIQLVGPNPNGVARDGTGCDLVLVADAGNQFGATDGTGGIERVDLSLRMSKGLAIKDTDLKGHPYTIATASKSLAFTTLTLGMGAGSQVFAFDPATGKLGASVGPEAGFIAFAQVTPDGSKLFVGVSSLLGMTKVPAIGVYSGPADGSMLPASGADVGQSPSSIAFF